MTTFSVTPVATPVRSWRSRGVSIAVWVVRALLAAQFAMGGVLKLTADAQMVALFENVGAGQGLRLLVGVCEVSGAMGLLIPRLVGFAASGLVLLMVGAVVTNVVVLQISPVLPLVFGALAAVVAVTTMRKGQAR